SDTPAILPDAPGLLEPSAADAGVVDAGVAGAIPTAAADEPDFDWVTDDTEPAAEPEALDLSLLAGAESTAPVDALSELQPPPDVSQLAAAGELPSAQPQADAGADISAPPALPTAAAEAPSDI